MKRCEKAPVWLSVALALAALGCGSADSASAAGAGGAADHPSGNPENQPERIEFDTTRIDFAPGEHLTVTARLFPARAYDVRFALIGDPADAYLDRSIVRTGDDGVARVELFAPSTAASFRIRASVGGSVSAELPVSVDLTPTKPLTVIPRYDSKTRADLVDVWTATVHPNTTCDDLSGVPPPDGPTRYRAEAPKGQDPRIDQVPIATPLAVTCRAGHFAGGCTDVAGLVENGDSSVVIDVMDRPLQMAEAEMDIQLGMTASTPWSAALEATIAEAARALVDASGEAQTLFGAMAAASDDDATAQHIEREAAGGDWTGIVDAAGSFSDTATSWMRAGVQVLERDDALMGHLVSTDASLSLGALTMASVGGQDPAEAGFSTDLKVTWTADPGDKVRVGATATWMPSRLVTALARAPAVAESKSAQSVAAALGEHLDCDGLGSKLSASASSPFASCDGACLADLCRSALGALWERARNSQIEPVTLEIAAGGVAQIDDSARPIGFEGAWVGTTHVFDLDVSVEGPARGIPPK